MKWLSRLTKTDKPIVLTAYTCRADVFELARLKYGNDLTPTWFKELPLKVEGLDKNMRGCAGLIDYQRKGFILPMWTEARVSIPPIGKYDWNYQSANNAGDIDEHASAQHNNFVDQDYFQHLKFGSPWQITCDEDVQFLCTSPDWHTKKPFEICTPNGVLNFKHQHSLQANIFFRKSEERQEFFMDFGRPLLHLVPLSDRKIVIEHKLVSHEELSMLHSKGNAKMWFDRSYYKARALRKKLQKKDKD